MDGKPPGKPPPLPPGQTPGERRRRPPASPEPDPPGLEEVLRRLNDFLGNGMTPGRLLALVFLSLLLTWAGLGFQLVRPGERAVVLRDGRLHTVLGPGLHWLPPGLASLRSVAVGEVRDATLATTVMSADDSLLEVTLALRYRVGDPVAYLLGFEDAESLLLRVADASLQQAATVQPLAELLRSGGLSPTVRRLAREALAACRCGLVLVGVSVTSMAPPAELEPAFAAARRAEAAAQSHLARVRRDVQQSLSAARTEGGRRRSLASRDAAGRLAAAQEESARFQDALRAWGADPEGTTRELYESALTEVLARTRTVIAGESGLEALGIPAARLRPSPLPPPPPPLEAP